VAYITSIQTVSITIGNGSTSNTATISSVNTSNTVVVWGGFKTDDSGFFAQAVWPRIELTDATTVTASRNISSTSTVTVYATIVEFDSSMISSVQAGTVTLSSAQTSNTATISAVTTSRSVVFYLGAINAINGLTPAAILFTVALTNSTTVTVARNTTGSSAMTAGFIVVEFQAAVIQSVQARSKTYTSPGNTTETDAISSVTTANTMLVWNGISQGSTSWANALYNLELTGSTAVTLKRSGNTTTSRTINYTVLEFVSGVLNSAQRGTTAFGANTSKDATITSVNTSYTIASWCGQLTSASSFNSIFTSAKLFDATTVRMERGSSTSDGTPGWEAIEFTAASPDSTLSESATLTDSYQITVASSLTQTESVSPSDSTLAIATASATLSESQTESDSVTSTIAYTNTFTETTTPSDTYTVITTGRGLTSESTTVTTAQNIVRLASVTLSETQSESDSYSASPVFSNTLSESITPTDSLAALSTGKPILSESATLTDNLGGKSTLSGQITETCTPTDTHLGQATGSTKLAETGTVTDTYDSQQSGGIIYNDSFTETITTTDTYSISATQRTGISEETAANDNYTSPSTEPLTPTNIPGPSDGAWDSYLTWLKKKKRKQFKQKAKKEGIPEALAEAIIERAAGAVIALQPQIKPPPFIPDYESARNTAQKTILAIYDQIWERMVYDTLARLEEEEDEDFLML
jgi:hypothetical protein